MVRSWRNFGRSERGTERGKEEKLDRGIHFTDTVNTLHALRRANNGSFPCSEMHRKKGEELTREFAVQISSPHAKRMIYFIVLFNRVPFGFFGFLRFSSLSL